MISHHAYPVEPWAIRETELDLDRLAQSESVFALANGHIGLRGNLDEGEPHGLPGTYLGGFWDARPLPYAEAGYGDPEQGQSVVNVTNGKIMRLLVGDSPFDVRYGRLNRHERVLDMRAGVLRRSVEWTSPSHQPVRVRSTRLVSLTQRAIVALIYEVEPLEQPVRVVVQSELIANEKLPDSNADPRAGSGGLTPLQEELREAADVRSIMIHRTLGSGLRVAAGMAHEVTAPEQAATTVEVFDDIARLVVATPLQLGESLRIVKYIGYGWSETRSVPALQDQVSAALSEAKATGWDGLLAAQREYLDDFWARADVEIEGDPELQQATRLSVRSGCVKSSGLKLLRVGERARGCPCLSRSATRVGYRGVGDMMVMGFPLGEVAVRPLGLWRPSTRAWRQRVAGSWPRCIG